MPKLRTRSRARSHRWWPLAWTPQRATAHRTDQARSRRTADIRATVRRRARTALDGADTTTELTVTLGCVVVDLAEPHVTTDSSFAQAYHDIVQAAHEIADELRTGGRPVNVHTISRHAPTPDGGRPDYQVHEVLLHIGMPTQPPREFPASPRE